MKTTKFTSLVLLLFFCACVKPGEQETCFDKLRNNGEQDIDCGGDCACPCKYNDPVVAPCSPTNNYASWGGINTFSGINTTGSFSSGNYVINGYYSSLFSVIVTIDDFPTLNNIYTSTSVSSCPTPYQLDCCVRANVSSNTYWYTGSVYINVVNGELEVTFCNLTSTQTSNNLTGKLTTQ